MQVYCTRKTCRAGGHSIAMNAQLGRDSVTVASKHADSCVYALGRLF